MRDFHYAVMTDTGQRADFFCKVVKGTAGRPDQYAVYRRVGFAANEDAALSTAEDAAGIRQLEMTVVTEDPRG